MRPRAGWICGVILVAACASTAHVEQPPPVNELEAPFPVPAPLTHEDAIGIAAAVVGMLTPQEHIALVENVACTEATCADGIDARAEALVLTKGSDMAETIELRRRSGHWTASWYGEAALRR